MHNAPQGTGSWFGWANAIISELTPTAAGIEIRRRKRAGKPIGYPMGILIAAAALSLTAQVAQARPTASGWISSAVPALAFLALTKLVLSSPRAAAEKEDSRCEPPAPPPSAGNAPTPSPARAPSPAPSLVTNVAATATGTTSPMVLKPAASSSSPAAYARTASPSDPAIEPVPTGQLLISARMAAFSHHQQAGTPITSAELANRMGIPPALAESLLDHLDGGSPPPVTAVNGTVINGSRP